MSDQIEALTTENFASTFRPELRKLSSLLADFRKLEDEMKLVPMVTSELQRFTRDGIQQARLENGHRFETAYADLGRSLLDYFQWEIPEPTPVKEIV